MRQKQTVRQKWGEDADMLGEGWTPTPRKVYKNLHKIALVPVPGFLNHRAWLSHFERDFLHAMLFEFSSFKGASVLKAITDEYGFSYRQTCRIVNFLEVQGLLAVERAKGLPHKLSLKPLFQKIRDLLGMKRKQDAVTDSPPVVEESQLVAEQPKPAPVPEPVPEPEPLPIAALVRASEWDTALERIKNKVSQATFNTWFGGTRAYKRGNKFVIQTSTTFNTSHLEQRFAYLIGSILDDFLPPSMEVAYETRSA